MKNCFIFMVFVLILFPSSLFPKDKAFVFMDETSSIDTASIRSIVTLIKLELEKNGVDAVKNDLPQITPPDTEIIEMGRVHGISRAFIVSALPIGEKIVLGLAEREISAGGIKLVFAEKITAKNIEEIDLLIPRLVVAVVKRTGIEDEVTIESLSSQEGRKYEKKFGQFLWGFGIPFGFALHEGSEFSYGIGAKGLYEMDNARVDLNGFLQFNNAGFKFFSTGIEAFYLFSRKDITPFVGGGINFTAVDFDCDSDKCEGPDDESMGLSFSIGGGVEFFRFYSTRLIFDLKLTLPTYSIYNSNSNTNEYIPVISSSIHFVW